MESITALIQRNQNLLFKAAQVCNATRRIVARRRSIAAEAIIPPALEASPASAAILTPADSISMD